MLRNTKDLIGHRLAAKDGEVGHIKDFYFDDEHWTIRYVVADTGNWLVERAVLISPFALGAIDTPDANTVGINLTKKQIEDCPPIESDKPVSRQYEEEYHTYYGWPGYWSGPLVWGQMTYPDPLANGSAPLILPPSGTVKPSGDPHLRSTDEVRGYHIQALDHEFGHVEDFIVDDRDWMIRYLIVETKSWWHGKQVLLSPEWISSVSWSESRVYIDFDSDTVKRSPEFDRSRPVQRKYEEQLFAFYNRPPYWEKKPHEIATTG
jgi:uncharacterized protein YrrD